MEIKGTRYSKESVVVVHVIEHDIPSFCVVTEFLIISRQEILICSFVKT